MKHFIFLALLLMCNLACDKKDSKDSLSSGSNFLPSVVELVDKASPSSFKNLSLMNQKKMGSIETMSTTTEAAEALKDFFTDSIMSISGITGKGLIRTYLKDLDGRISEVENGSQPDCFTASPHSVIFDSGLTNQSLTLKLSCVRSFGGTGDQSGAGSGMAFGQDETSIYLYLLLVQQNSTDKFGYLAKVNKTTEEVDLLFLEYFPTYNRNQFFRLKTNPATSKFELVLAGTGGGVGPAQTNTSHIFDPGVRLVTNSTEIKADGSVATTTNASGAPSTGFAFDTAECFDASNLTAAPTACTGLAPSFSSDMSLVLATALPAVASSLNSALQTMPNLITLGISEM
jgi:hypothetical protein